jgi:hypothetical protein
VPKPLTSGAKADGRFGKQDFVYRPDENAYCCPAGERLPWRFTTVEAGLTLHKYWLSNCAVARLRSSARGQGPPSSTPSAHVLAYNLKRMIAIMGVGPPLHRAFAN